MFCFMFLYEDLFCLGRYFASFSWFKRPMSIYICLGQFKIYLWIDLVACDYVEWLKFIFVSRNVPSSWLLKIEVMPLYGPFSDCNWIMLLAFHIFVPFSLKGIKEIGKNLQVGKQSMIWSDTVYDLWYNSIYTNLSHPSDQISDQENCSSDTESNV